METKTVNIIQQMLMARFQNLASPQPPTVTPHELKLWNFLDLMRCGQAQQANKILVSNWSPDDYNLLINAGIEIYVKTLDDQTEGMAERTR
ncbi:hypothetical protein BG000_005375, partial [Podila horticola]